MLRNEYLVAEIGFETAEKERSKNCQLMNNDVISQVLPNLAQPPEYAQSVGRGARGGTASGVVGALVKVVGCGSFAGRWLQAPN